MNLEEARNNIGAEVELDKSTKPYTYKSHFSKRDCEKSHNPEDGRTYIIDEIRGNGNVCIKGDFYEDIHPRHLKLKPQNYKIHVSTEVESREAQELFFKLGYVWSGGSNTVKYSNEPYLYAFKNKTIKRDHARYEKVFNAHNAKQITLQDLRNMVAKKKQTQPIQESVKPIVDGLETIIAIQDFDSNSDEDKTVQVAGTFQNFETRKEMTWEDALRAVADDRKVEFYNELCEQWWDISRLSATEVVGIEKFRLAPKRIYLNGNFTKEQLLQKAGEME